MFQTINIISNNLKSLPKETSDLVYDSFKVQYKSCELYNNFIQSLLQLVNDSYLGDDMINTEELLIKHFDWCFNSIVDGFKQENIHFINNKELYNYFLVFTSEMFYYVRNKENVMNNIIDVFTGLLNLNSINQ